MKELIDMEPIQDKFNTSKEINQTNEQYKTAKVKLKSIIRNDPNGYISDAIKQTVVNVKCITIQMYNFMLFHITRGYNNSKTNTNI